MTAKVITLRPSAKQIREAELQEMRRKIMERVADLHETLIGDCVEGTPFDADVFRDQALKVEFAIDAYFRKDNGPDE